MDRNERIAKAMGLKVITLSGGHTVVDCGDTTCNLNDYDFDSYEWQDKIRLWVWGLWIEGREDNHWFTVEIRRNKVTITFRSSNETCWWHNGYVTGTWEPGAWEEALFKLSEKEVTA